MDRLIAMIQQEFPQKSVQEIEEWLRSRTEVERGRLQTWYLQQMFSTKNPQNSLAQWKSV
jgi:hypothetical protein